MGANQGQYRPPNAGRATRRFGSYLLGVAIGLVLVGVLMQMRSQMLGPRATPAPGPTAPSTD